MGDVTFSGGALAIITALVGALCGAIGLLFRALMASKDAGLADMTSQRNSYQRMAYQSVAALEVAANKARKSRGEPPFEVIPAVTPEHNSPVTLLARASAAARELDMTLADLPDRELGAATNVPTSEVALQPGETITITALPANHGGVGG